MKRFKVDMDLDETAIRRLAVRTSGVLAKTGAEAVQARARRYAPVRTGALRQSIAVTKVRDGIETTYSVGSDLHYAPYQEFGTGPIYPRKKGGVLRWTDGPRVIFARRTRGVPAVRYMQRAAARITLRDFAKAALRLRR